MRWDEKNPLQAGGTKMAETHRGKCLCEKVRFTATGPMRGVIYCHCTQCRRQTGHFVASTNVPNDRLKVSGVENLRWFQSSDEAKRGFCANCGSVLFWKMDSLDYTSILAGAFDAPSGLVADKHIFVADKGDYYEIDDGLPQFEKSSADIKVAGS